MQLGQLSHSLHEKLAHNTAVSDQICTTAIVHNYNLFIYNVISKTTTTRDQYVISISVTEADTTKRGV